MKKLLMMAVVAFLFTTAVQAQTQRKTDTTQQRMHQQRPKMAQQLGLNADQQAKLKAMHQEVKKRSEALKQDGTLSKEQKKEKYKEIKMYRKGELQKILTPEQYKKMETMQKENKGKHKGHMKGKKENMQKAG